MFRKILTRARDPHQKHRVATPLELYFDLVYVISIASAVNGLHHAISAHHYFDGSMTFIITLFASYWSWTNYTYYSSAFDNGDYRFRFSTMLSMVGALFFAIGTNIAFATGDFTVGAIGFIIMRLSMISMWLRVYREDKRYRQAALRYMIGLAIIQTFWTIVATCPEVKVYFHYLMWVGMVGEMLVPYIAGRNNPTPWHPHHISERYGLLAIIILGEGFVAIVNTISPLFERNFNPYTEILPLAFAMSTVLFSAFLLYFKVPFADILHHSAEDENGKRNHGFHVFVAAYGHFLIYAGIALICVGLELSADAITAHLAGSGDHHLTSEHHSVSEYFAGVFLSIATLFYTLAIFLVHSISASMKTFRFSGLILGIVTNMIGLALIASGTLHLQYAMWFICLSPFINSQLYLTKSKRELAEERRLAKEKEAKEAAESLADSNSAHH